MPQGSNARKSKSNQKSRAPAHQNQFAFQHNPKSKRTDQILNSPNVHVCRRCHDKIEWRKKYRKYKPRTQPGMCNWCQKRNVKAAYHTICTDCTISDRARRVMAGNINGRDFPSGESPKDIVESTARMRIRGDPKQGHSSDAAEGAETRVEVWSLSESCHERVCAMCSKEPALPDEPNEAETVDDVLLRENRRIRLRERRSIERKVIRQQEEVKQAAKLARRQVRLEEASGNDGDTDQELDDHGIDKSREEEEQLTIVVHTKEKDEEEEDPFLKAVGGADRLLTGESYRNMLLEQNAKT